MSDIPRSPRPRTPARFATGGDPSNKNGSYQTSLDNFNTKLEIFTGSRRTRKTRKTERKPWSKKKKRAYQRAMSGIKVADILGKRLRFMTLTSAPGASWEDINSDFDKLKKQIRWNFKFFEYFKVKTWEGYGVLHILYRGTYIDQQWLSNAWSDLHGGSCIVDVREVRMKKKSLARYLVTQYVAGQSFTRMSWSWRWVFRGFVRVWKSVIRRCRGEPLEKILAEWKKILYQHCFRQVSIYEYLAEHPPPDWRLVTDDWWRKNVRKCS